MKAHQRYRNKMFQIDGDKGFFVYVNKVGDVGAGSDSEQALRTVGRHNHWVKYGGEMARSLVCVCDYSSRNLENK